MTRLAALVGLAATCAALLASSSPSLQGPALINITQGQVRHAGLQRVIGDDEFWVYYLHNHRITKAVIGYSIMRCEFYGRGGPLGSGVSDCAAIYSLAKGKIVARGIVKTRDYYTLAIVGGTGYYSNVRGEVVATTIKELPHVEQLVFSLEV